MNKGESPAIAAKREAFEEIGRSVSVTSEIPLYVFKSNNFQYHNFLIVTPHEFAPFLDWESDDYVWVSYGEWPKPMHFGLSGIINDAKSSEILRNISTE